MSDENICGSLTITMSGEDWWTRLIKLKKFRFKPSIFQVRKVSSKEGLHIVSLQGRLEHVAGPCDGELHKMVEIIGDKDAPTEVVELSELVSLTV